MSLKDMMGRIFGGKAGAGVEELARRMGMTAEALAAVKVVYHEFEVPKRDGRKRTISAPDPELMKAQRLILRRVLGRLKAHPAAHGFERGKSIVTNAQAHAGKAVVARMDVRDFFPSTRQERVETFFRKIGWDSRAAALLTRLCAWKGGLPQGAPTSPRLSNLINYKLDARLDALAKVCGAAYTRYADDITFSCAAEAKYRAQNPKTGEVIEIKGRPRVGWLLVKTAEILLEDGYGVHKRRKMSVRRRHQRQIVTGLVVNERPRLPREVRRRLRAMEHQLAAGRPVDMKPGQLEGWRAFAGMVERNGMPDQKA